MANPSNTDRQDYILFENDMKIRYTITKTTQSSTKEVFQDEGASDECQTRRRGRELHKQDPKHP